MDKKKKKGTLIKTIAIFTSVFIVIPLVIITLIYYTNDSFNSYINRSLNKMPGFIGEHFSKYPTEGEKEDKKLFLASYYLELDSQSSADKMYIVKKSDEVLFNDIVKIMNSISSTKTEEILKVVRSIELRKDLLFSLYDEVQQEKEGNFSIEAARIEKLPLSLALQEIEDLAHSKMSDSKNTSAIFSRLSSSRISESIYYLGSDTKDKILYYLDLDKKIEVTALLREKELLYDELASISRTYEVKDSKKSFNEIGSIGLYSIDELANIYMNLSVKKAGEILSNSNDEEFIEELFSEIRKEEALLKKEESVTVDIRKYINFLNEYEGKIQELVNIYSKMKPEEAAPIIDKMISNDNSITLFNIDGASEFKISDSSIIVDVLTRMKGNILTQILDYVEPDKAVDITRKLATPLNN